MVSSIRTVPEPSMIGFSKVKTRPTSASARRLRKGLLALTELLLFASRRHTGTATAANTANIRSCVCQDGCTTNDTNPTSSAASPSQNRKTPGAANSSAIRTNPKISQFQVPSVLNVSAKTRPHIADLLPCHRRRRWHGGRYRRGAAGRCLRRQGTFAEGRLGDLTDAGERAQHAGRLH